MFLSDLSIKRPILVSMGLVFFLLFGSMAYFGMPLDLTPSVDIPYVTIQTVYQGAGPREVETQVTKKIEDAISSVSRIESIRSYSMENVSFINVEFELDKDVDIAKQEVSDKVDAVLNDLPDDADLPIVQKLNIQEFPIIDVILTGDYPVTTLWDLADKKIKDRFAQIEGVARAEVSGGQEREIEVVLDNRVVFKNALSLQQLSSVLKAQNMDMPGGYFDRRGQEYSVRLEGEFDDVKALSDLEVATPYGSKKLSDLAEVKDTGAEVRERTSYFNNLEKRGNPDVVQLSLTKSSEGNTVAISEAVNEMLPGLVAQLPETCNLEIVKDKSIFIVSSVKDTLENILMGILLTGLVLLVFLHDARSTIIVAVAMPMSILSAFMLMDLSGFSLNIMSLMGLSTAVGVLVSNSVVVLENIFRHKNAGQSRREAASIGTSEVVVAVIASTMTNIAVFLPIAGMESIVGRFFVQFALTVTYATLFSLLISFTLTPMLASLILPEKNKKKHPIGDKAEAFFSRMEDAYRRILAKLLMNKRRSALIIAIAGVLFVASFPIAGRVGFEFMPLMDEGDIRIEVELPLGYSLDETATTLSAVENVLKSHGEVKHVVTTLGFINQTNVGTNLAVMNVKLVDASKRDVKTNVMTGRFIEELSVIPNARIRVATISSIAGGDRPTIQFNLMGQDVDKVEAYKEEILRRIRDIDGLVNLNTSSRSGKPEIKIIPDRKKMTDAGVTVYGMAMALRGALTGLVATQYKDKGEEYDIRVMMSDESVDSPEKVENITVVSGSGKYAISQLADVEFATGYSQIQHVDKYKSIEFTAAPAPGVPLGTVVDGINARISDVSLPEGYKIEWAGFSNEMRKTTAEMARTFVIAVILTYMLLAAILESLTQPLLVLGTVPLALIGVFGGLYTSGLTMNMVSMMAIVMLLGIVVNNAILILDYMNTLVKEKGYDVRTALLEASPLKLKPILMSSIAIILGMLPMALGWGDAGREMRQPMGVVAIGGLLVSTVLSLFIIPALQYLVARTKGDAVTNRTTREA